jgi:hypothetical protein
MPVGCERNAPVWITPDDRKRSQQGTNWASAAGLFPRGNRKAFAVSTPWPDREIAGQGRLSASKLPGPRGEQLARKPALGRQDPGPGPVGPGRQADRRLPGRPGRRDRAVGRRRGGGSCSPPAPARMYRADGRAMHVVQCRGHHGTSRPSRQAQRDRGRKHRG